MLIQSFKVPEGKLDSVARRMSFLKDKLKDWCYQASIQKNQMSREKGGSKIVTPTPGVPEEPFLDGDHGSPSPKLEHINLDK